eukprot:CAMPEP_0170268968 /NCGR_PEP_ID=MMETSP0116_2-20130129/34417_1 /TAXON_ID=400756 /ORGANISM="Durinskia baltica, Strain CSIRO CS-38" /LENGTH=236 /DNA_ID=CAMNT_0010520137 /DNA_START=28 /DNA_END=739 /DNA_ORIENTATION=+
MESKTGRRSRTTDDSNETIEVPEVSFLARAQNLLVGLEGPSRLVTTLRSPTSSPSVSLDHVSQELGMETEGSSENLILCGDLEMSTTSTTVSDVVRQFEGTFPRMGSDDDEAHEGCSVGSGSIGGAMSGSNTSGSIHHAASAAPERMPPAEAALKQNPTRRGPGSLETDAWVADDEEKPQAPGVFAAAFAATWWRCCAPAAAEHSSEAHVVAPNAPGVLASDGEEVIANRAPRCVA